MTARQVVVLQEQLAKLSPSYDDCPSPCARSIDEGKASDLPDLCETCDVRFQLKFFREAVEHEITERFGQIEWSFDSLLADVSHAMKVNADLRGRGYPKNCSALLAECLNILRREEQRPLRIFRWEQSQRKPTQ